MAWFPISSLLTEQLVSCVESRRPKGPQPDDPILLQLEEPLLLVGTHHVVQQGDLEVGDGLLHVALVVLLEVASHTTVLPLPPPDV